VQYIYENENIYKQISIALGCAIEDSHSIAARQEKIISSNRGK